MARRIWPPRQWIARLWRRFAAMFSTPVTKMHPENESESPFAEIFRAGAAAFWDDLNLSNNPYVHGTRAYEQWNDGYHAAQSEVNRKARKQSQGNPPAEQED